jgi:phosphoribosylformylglycinamidine synthase
MKGLTFELPPGLEGKTATKVEVGPFGMSPDEINRFLGTNITEMTRIDTYVLVHNKEVEGLETLVQGKPFVDPIIQQAAVNEPLAQRLGIQYDHVLHAMVNPGTSDSTGKIALKQAMIALGQPVGSEDKGFYTKQYLIKGDLTPQQLEAVSAFLDNPDLHKRAILSKAAYDAGHTIPAPIVTLPPEIRVETYDVLNMNDQELLNLSKTRKLAATLQEMQIFRDMYKDEKFIVKRREVELDEKATDVELETYFGLRSEHCFHKEFNAKITLDDRVDDHVFRRAHEKGWLTTNNEGEYVLERGIFKTFIRDPAETIFQKLQQRGNNWIASMFEDNSGVVYYDADYMYCIKFETHNSPSNIEPIQGSKTGIDGVNRDILGTMLATFRLMSNFFWFCTGDPRYKGWLPGKVKHPYTLLKGETQGVREGGNESQVATLGGGVTTFPPFIAKTLVYCGTIGFSPVCDSEGRRYLSSDGRVGDIHYVVGNEVGIDGVHGATESSLIADKFISLGHVQADDSYVQVNMRYFMLEAALEHLFSEVTDCGAMGIGSTCEMAKKTKGLRENLANHPKKYNGIQPWQTKCSETQDRMVIAVHRENVEKMKIKARKHDVMVAELGELTDTGFIQLDYGDRTVALLDMERLFDPEPRKQMHATWYKTPDETASQIKGTYTLTDTLCRVMELPDVASKEWFFRQKDSRVGGETILGPLIGLKQEVEADATIQKPLETQGRDYGAIAYAMGLAPKGSDIDAYHSAQVSFMDMVGKIVALGVALPDMENPIWDAWAVCGNYCQPNSDSTSTLVPESGEHNLASLLRETIAIREAIEATNIPVISGKDSMKCSCVYDIDIGSILEKHDSRYGEFYRSLPEEHKTDIDTFLTFIGQREDAGIIDSIILEAMPADLRQHVAIVKDEKTGGRKIEIHDPDSYLASAAVKVQDYRKCVTPDFKQAGDLVYVVGTTRDHIGASQYLAAVGYQEQGAPLKGGAVAKVDLDEFVGVAAALHQAAEEEVLASSKYVFDGGIGVAVSKAAMAGELGCQINLGSVVTDDRTMSDESIMYSESRGRWVLSVAPEHKQRFEELMANVPCSLVGKVTDENYLKVVRRDATLEQISMGTVKYSFQSTLRFDLDAGYEANAQTNTTSVSIRDLIAS